MCVCVCVCVLTDLTLQLASHADWEDVADTASDQDIRVAQALRVSGVAHTDTHTHTHEHVTTCTSSPQTSIKFSGFPALWCGSTPQTAYLCAFHTAGVPGSDT